MKFPLCSDPKHSLCPLIGNPLDVSDTTIATTLVKIFCQYCRDHDIVYATSKNLNDRHRADKVLENRAWERFKAKDTPR